MRLDRTCDDESGVVGVEQVWEVGAGADVGARVVRLRVANSQRPHAVVDDTRRQLAPILSRPCQRVHQLDNNVVWHAVSSHRDPHPSGYDKIHTHTHTHTHTHPFNGPFSRTTWVSRYQKGKTNLDFTEARDSEWQWHQLGHLQVCTLLQTDNHASNPSLSFLQARCPTCRPTNNIRYDTRCYFNVRSKADMSQLNLPHGTNN